MDDRKEVKIVMPGFVIHLAIAKEYLERHKDNQEDEDKFYRGVIAPDLLKKPESHYEPSTSEPDFERYARETGLSSRYEGGTICTYLQIKIFIYPMEMFLVKNFSMTITS